MTCWNWEIVAIPRGMALGVEDLIQLSVGKLPLST